MKHILLPILFFCISSSLSAQTTPGPVEKKITNSICDCLNKVDIEKIHDKENANKAFMNCFSSQANMLVQLAEERNVSMTDQAAMQNLGTDIGKNLLQQNCNGFIQLSFKMAGDSDEDTNTGVTEGQLKRIETKDFNYFVITDSDKKERSFIWLRHFPGSDEFITNAEKYKGKKLSIEWQEMEVYVPAAKNYYTIKEIVDVKVL